MSVENIIQPTWNPSSFLRPSTTAALASTTAYASHVSARNLKAPCPPLLLKALNEDFVDRSTWLDPYDKEKEGLLENDTYVKISPQ